MAVLWEGASLDAGDIVTVRPHASYSLQPIGNGGFEPTERLQKRGFSGSEVAGVEQHDVDALLAFEKTDCSPVARSRTAVRRT